MDEAQFFDEQQKAEETRRRIQALIREIRRAVEADGDPDDLIRLAAAAEMELNSYGLLRTLAHLRVDKLLPRIARFSKCGDWERG